MFLKGIFPVYSRSQNQQLDSDDEVNQEVPQNFISQVSSAQASPPRQVAPSAAGRGAAITVDFNWQASQPTVRDRNAVMFNNDLMADVHFVVGQAPHVQRIPAHKYVLATGSSVFYAMLYGGLADCKGEIEIPDVEPQAFLNLLK